MNFHPPSMTRQAIATVGAAVAFFLLLMLAVHLWQKSRSQGVQSRVDAAQGQAKTESAGDAVNTVAGAGEREAAAEELTRKNEQEIRNAEGANTRVGAGVDVAGRRALCLRAAYRDDPKCRMFKPNP